MPTKVEVEYCGSCGHKKQFDELAAKVQEALPSAQVTGHEGRRGSFEITVNETLVHSKLQTLAFPDYTDLVDVVMDTESGKPVRTTVKQQPITCIIS